MNFGQNLYQWFLSNAQSLVLMAIVVIGIYLGFKREFSKLIGFLVVALIAVGLVFNAGGVKDVLLELFNKIIGACGNDIRVYDDELAEALKQLSERNRETLLMYYFLEMNNEEIAKKQNISRSGVFQNRHNSLVLMKKLLKEKQ